jgi:membrane-associated phospholipid phosphatase
MPSMHVASSIIVMLLAYRINRGLGHLMLAFTNVMMIGSVHLGWHYAVDGLFGAALALACWYAAERVAALDLAFQRRMLPRVGSD